MPLQQIHTNGLRWPERNDQWQVGHRAVRFRGYDIMFLLFLEAASICREMTKTSRLWEVLRRHPECIRGEDVFIST